MAGEKTEKPTPKKRRDARKEGDIFKSNEVNSWISIGAGILAFSFLWKSMFIELQSFFIRIFSDEYGLINGFGNEILAKVMLIAIGAILKTAAPLLMIVMAAGLFSNYVQVGFLFVPKAIKPKMERISITKGLKRLFSMKSLKELIKSLLKVTGISIIGYFGIMNLYEKVYITLDMDLYTSIEMTVKLFIGIILNILLAMAVVAITDYIFQYFEYEKKLKMSKQEVKDEYKTTEGNPEIKSKVREIQRSMASMRMMHHVPESDVVITNPTHFAIALKYDPEKNSAPLVIAKGADKTAEKIKEIAVKNNITIVENKEVARALFKTAEIGKEIPFELFNAVAEILAYIYRMKGKSGR